jgi:hypothetical protein
LPRPARVRVSLAATLLLLGRRPRCLGGTIRCTPPHYIKGSPRRRGDTPIHEPSSTASSYHLPGAPAPSGPPPLPLSLTRGLLKSCVGDGNHHRDTPSCCGVSGSLFQSIYYRISAGNGVPGVIVVAVHV